MSGTRLDPRTDVVAPVERALSWLIVRAAGSFAISVAAVLATLLHLEGTAHLLAHLILPALLILVLVARWLHALSPKGADGDHAWERAREFAPSDTRLAALAALAVPAAWLVGGVAVLVRHAVEDPAAVVSLYGPVFLLLWFGASIAWAGDCRERLALALAESDRRFRAYWHAVADRDA